jgi:potassium-dependent mechanosensitive channel
MHEDREKTVVWVCGDRQERSKIATLAITAVVLLAIFVTAGVPARSQEQQADGSFDGTAQNWDRSLDRIENYAEGGVHSDELHRGYGDQLKEITTEAKHVQAEAERQVNAKSRLLDSLGPAPAEGEPAESEGVAQERKQLTESIAGFKAQLSQADLTLTRARDLQDALSQAVRTRFVEQLLIRDRSPLAPGVLSSGAPEFVAVLGLLARAPIEWYQGLAPERRWDIWLNWRFSFFLVAIVLGFLIRRVLLRRLGPNPNIEDPTYTRRFVAAIAKAIADGIVPAGLLAVIYFRIKHDTELISGLPSNVLTSICLLLIVFFLTRAVTRAVLAPELLPWRLTQLTPQAASKLSRRIMVLAVIFAIAVFFKGLKGAVPDLPVTDELRAFYVFVMGTLQAFGTILVMLGDGWRTASEAPSEGAPKDGTPAAAGGDVGEQTVGARASRLARRSVMGLAVLGVAVAAVGYIRLGFYLIDNLVVSAATIAVLFLLRGMLRELIGMALRTDVVKRRAGLGAETRRTLKFWLRAVLDPVLFGFGLYVIAQYWGVPPGDMANWIASILAGFTIGGVTISLVDIALAITVFAIGLVVTRILRQGLADKVLPKTRLDVGVRNSISVGAGYVGVVIAMLMAIGVLGIDLSNIAIIAGALSVGIGFGLQNIVNNFVSGLILLIERPIKVGDWVVVGATQGYVKQINVRATEITTFERASVILPNSELLSSAVTNWTHKDKMGRVEVRVGVAYGSDTEKVSDILLACAKTHPDIMSWPAPFVLFSDFGASSLDFDLRAYLRDVEKRIIVASELRFAVDKAFREAGIEIPFPQSDLHLKDIDRLEQALTTRTPAGKAPSAPVVPLRNPVPSIDDDKPARDEPSGGGKG